MGIYIGVVRVQGQVACGCSGVLGSRVVGVKGMMAQGVGGQWWEL